MTSPHLNIGVLVARKVQFLDVAAVDLLGMLDIEYLQLCKMPEPVIANAVPNKIHYIVTDAPGTQAAMTAEATLTSTVGHREPSVQPGSLDILVVPGPDPFAPCPDEEAEFVAAHHRSGAVILSICSGITIVAASGILKGKTATAPRPMIPSLKEHFPETEWVEKRWVECEDGTVWSSGGIVNGMDMIAAYVSKVYPKVGPIVVAMADVSNRSEEYDTPALEALGGF